MSDPSRDALWRQLCEAGLAQGDLPARAERPSPWFIRLMLGVAGWIGALFLLGFVGAGLAFVFRSEGAAVVVGLLCCGAAYVIFVSGRKSELATQFGLAVSLAGQVMVVYGLHEGFGFGSDSPVFFLEVAIFEAALAALLTNFVHRVWSTLAAAIALNYALNLMGLWSFGSVVVALGLAVLWLREDQWAARGSLWRAVGYGLAAALVQPSSYVAGWFFLRNPAAPLFGEATFWIRAVLLAGVLLYVVFEILREYSVEPAEKAGALALAAAAIIGVATFRASGVTAAVIIMLLGFARGNRGLFGFGVLALLSYLSYFYYALHMTLLMKSLALAANGAILVALWVIMRVIFGEPLKEPARA